MPRVLRTVLAEQDLVEIWIHVGCWQTIPESGGHVRISQEDCGICRLAAICFCIAL